MAGMDERELIMGKLYDEKIYAKVSQWFDEHMDEMTEDIQRIVRFRSVSNHSAKPEEGPFGQACRDVLDDMLAMGREYGFHTENKEYYVGTISVENPDWSNTIGMWNHLDVVPAGEGWAHDPFDPYIKDGYLIGRGVSDNKGPAVAMLYVMRCLRDLNIPMKHELCLFVGCDEEKGMEDMKYYTANYPTPALSLIADSGFPVCYGEKGILEGKSITGRFSDDIMEFYGGTVSNMVPGRAYMTLKKDMSQEQTEALQAQFGERIAVTYEDGLLKLTALGMSKHSAAPEGSINAIHELADLVSETDLLCENDRKYMEFISNATSDFYGEWADIAYEDEISGKLTCAGTMLKLDDHRASLLYNIRYSITADVQHIQKGLAAASQRNGCEFELVSDSAPGYFSRERKVVDLLTDVYNEITGLETKPYVMSGGTYARKLPNAIAYGLGGVPRREGAPVPTIENGHGGAHQPDEMLDLQNYIDAAKIFTMAVLALNDYDLNV